MHGPSSTPTAQPLPFGGELLAAVASALRLGDVRAGSQAVSPTTVKRLARGLPQVAASKCDAMLEEIVATLFKERYLAARGLSADEIDTHHRMVVTAIEEVIVHWDALAGRLNNIDLRLAPGIVVHAIGKATFLDAEARCAAFLCLYAPVHRVLGLIDGWMREPGLKGCIEGLRCRSRRQWTNQAVCAKADIAKNTWKALREGQALPRDNTLEKLAHAIADFDVRIGVDEVETPEEIELELRVACALADVLAWKERHSEAAETLDFHIGTVLRLLRHDMRRYGPIELAEIITRGTAWRRWPEIEARLWSALGSIAAGEAAHFAVHMERRQRSIEALFKTDPKAALRRSADDFAESAARTRASVASLPGWERSVAGDVVRFFEHSELLFRAMAEDRELPVPGRVLGEEFKAKCLCAHALAPWTGASRKEREARLLEAIETYPGSSEVRARYGDFLAMDPERIEEAMTQIRLAVILDEDNDQARQMLAVMLMNRGEIGVALEHLDELEVRGRTTASTANLRGYCCIEMGRWVAAEMAFEQALALQPRLAPALRGRARCRRAAGDEVGARRFLRDAEFYESGKRAGA